MICAFLLALCQLRLGQSLGTSFSYHQQRLEFRKYLGLRSRDLGLRNFRGHSDCG